MKVPPIINDNIDSESLNNSKGVFGKTSNRKKDMSSPFYILDFDKKRGVLNIAKKVENVNMLITSQTDKLLIEGFDGSEEDFKKCYHKTNSIKFKKVLDNKHRRINNNFLKDGYRTIRLTKTKEFNLSDKRKKNKLIEHLKINKHFNFNSNKSLKSLKNGHYLFNSLFSDNSTHKSNYINSSNSIPDNNINNKISNLYNLIDKSDLNLINRNYGKTFYFYKKNINDHNNTLKDIRNHLGTLKQFTSLRNILNDASHNIININGNLKRYLEKDNLYFSGSHSTRNKSKSNKFFNSNEKEDNKIKDILDIFKKNKKYSALKLVKKDDGVNSQNIWIRKSTANLISFGKSFINLDDYHFYKERKRIMEDYPKLEKEADISIDGIETKVNDNTLIKIRKIKMAKNSQKMKDLNNMNNFMLKKIKERIKVINKKVK